MNGFPAAFSRTCVRCFLAFWVAASAGAYAERVLFRFDEDFDVAAVEARDATITRNGNALRLATGHEHDRPGITLKVPGGRWDLAEFEHLVISVANVGHSRVKVSCRVDSRGPDGTKHSITQRIELEPGQKKVFRVALRGRMSTALGEKLFGMRGYPGGWFERRGIDVRHVGQLSIFVERPTADCVLEIADVRATGRRLVTTPADAEKLFPMIDAFGQFAHKDWPGKIKSADDFAKRKQTEAADLAAFYTKTAEEYFRACREAVHEVDPKGLYLGCRFAWVNDRAVRASAKYCDVVSFNRYKRGVADFRLPQGVDKPVVIGEFHFGALDRGMLHTGLVPVADQQDRVAAYKGYVRGALANPWIVGTHWFQYGDQATTGRGDGENYQIGLLDICDTPYQETVAAVREAGYDMYEYRRADPPAKKQPAAAALPAARLHAALKAPERPNVLFIMVDDGG